MMPDTAYRKLIIKKIVSETKDAKTFYAASEDNSVMEYKAGQFITLVFNTRHGEKRRSYSISSAPGIDNEFFFTVKQIENGEFSRWLVTKAKEGDVLYSSGISGKFILPENNDKTDHYFFLAAGSGITPCFSLIKKLLFGTDKKVILIYSNRSEKDTIFLSGLTILLNQFPKRFITEFFFSESADLNKSRLSNRLLNQLLDKYLMDPFKTACYICGPFEYLRMVEITLNIRIPHANIHKENFNSLPVATNAKPPDVDVHQASIHFNKTVYIIPVQYPQTILAAAKQSNIRLPYSCEAGRCSSCMATLMKGKVWMAYNEVLTDDEVADGKILVCQSFPIEGDVEIKYE